MTSGGWVLFAFSEQYISSALAGIINGAAHYIEHLMFKGTKRRPTTADISRTLDAIDRVSRGQSLIVWAIGEGRNAAFGADKAAVMTGAAFTDTALLQDGLQVSPALEVPAQFGQAYPEVTQRHDSV